MLIDVTQDIMIRFLQIERKNASLSIRFCVEMQLKLRQFAAAESHSSMISVVSSP